ncbi:hypothetical protein [Streptomyces sp. ISL-11]|uniref:hypothetical protein n=1 Tax=Streptomyces sp. ISL-11 TaxID=2819174 RepID=UPI001BE77541|nr:hypothetical protein [Streptomyces sp. ISL-11]MBT2382186.1 hypothetical protein [Streptomyces sp. ISL-11]
MRRASSVSLGTAALLLPLTLTACGTERSGTPDARPAHGKATVDRADLAARARAIETTTDMIYVIKAPGFEAARQSVGVHGDDGFSSAYVSKSGGIITLTVDRGTLNETNCPTASLQGAVEGKVMCERDGDSWYRTAAGAQGHEYALAKDGRVVRLGSDAKTVNRDTLRAAARSVHLGDERELDALLPPLRERGGSGPTERGDLPPVGDGAPDNRPPNAGG